MPNGIAALHLALEPTTPACAKATVGKPGEPPAKAAIEIELGAAVADAATALARAMTDYRHRGALDPETRQAGAERIARIATLQLNHELGDLDFSIKARAAGRDALQAYLDAGFFEPYTQEQKVAALDLFIGEALAIAAKVVRDERAWAN